LLIALLIFEPPRVLWPHGVLMVGPCLALSAAGFAYFAYKWGRIGKRVIVYSDGLACVQAGKTTAIRWKKLTAVKEALVTFYVNGILSHTNRFVTVKAADGTEIYFAGPPGKVERVALLVVKRAYRAARPKLMRKLDAGETVSLGPIQVS